METVHAASIDFATSFSLKLDIEPSVRSINDRYQEPFQGSNEICVQFGHDYFCVERFLFPEDYPSLSGYLSRVGTGTIQMKERTEPPVTLLGLGCEIGR